MKLSVCLIVKDEHDVLARCLVGARRFADEIVVVDTGSSDDTAEIAKNLQIKYILSAGATIFLPRAIFLFQKRRATL